jgi:hypothetical protein
MRGITMFFYFVSLLQIVVAFIDFNTEKVNSATFFIVLAFFLFYLGRQFEKGAK